MAGAQHKSLATVTFVHARTPAIGWGIYGYFYPYLLEAPPMHGALRHLAGKGGGVFPFFLPYLRPASSTCTAPYAPESSPVRTEGLFTHGIGLVRTGRGGEGLEMWQEGRWMRSRERRRTGQGTRRAERVALKGCAGFGKHSLPGKNQGRPGLPACLRFSTEMSDLHHF